MIINCLNIFFCIMLCKKKNYIWYNILYIGGIWYLFYVCVCNVTSVHSSIVFNHLSWKCVAWSLECMLVFSNQQTKLWSLSPEHAPWIQWRGLEGKVQKWHQADRLLLISHRTSEIWNLIRESNFLLLYYCHQTNFHITAQWCRVSKFCWEARKRRTVTLLSKWWPS